MLTEPFLRLSAELRRARTWSERQGELRSRYVDNPNEYFGDVILDTALFIDQSLVKILSNNVDKVERYALAMMHQAQLYYQQASGEATS